MHWSIRVSICNKDLQMKKYLACLLITLLLNALSCSNNSRLFSPNSSITSLADSSQSITNQQLLAYPVLSENPYLVLYNFEDQNELDDAAISNQSKESAKISWSGSPIATGSGALAINIRRPGNISTVIDPAIRNWSDFNLLLLAVFNQGSSSQMKLAFSDSDNRSAAISCYLEKNWNKLQVDLRKISSKINLSRVRKIEITLTASSSGTVIIDDLILTNALNMILGSLEGQPTVMYAYSTGPWFHIGCHTRYEIVIHHGKITSWFDLSQDPRKKQNLLPTDNQGLNFFQESDNLSQTSIPENSFLKSSQTLVESLSANRIKLTANLFFSNKSPSDQPDQTFTYLISPDGLITFEISSPKGLPPKISLDMPLNARLGFEPVIGKIHNQGISKPFSVDYILARRMAKNAGSDFLFTLDPSAASDDPIRASVKSNNDKSIIRLLLTKKILPNETSITGMMRIWPDNIDHIGNAEIYIRKYFQKNPSPDKSLPRSSSNEFNPSWKID
jgi:hypothetical protein